MIAPCEIISARLGGLFSCEPIDGHVRVRTPFLFPDGDVIDVYVREEGATITVADLGESLRWLRMQTPGQRKTPKQRQLISDVCVNHGVELFRGMLMARVTAPEALADAVIRLSQASLRVADLWFTLRMRSVESANDEVADFLRERAIPFEQGQRLPGRSGKAWSIDFHTRHPRRSAFLQVLSTGSRAGAQTVVKHVVTMWHDLSHFKVGPEGVRFVSLFDDTADVWVPEDFRLVEGLSDSAFWSRPDGLIEKLAA